VTGLHFAAARVHGLFGLPLVFGTWQRHQEIRLIEAFSRPDAGAKAILLQAA
jgi:hypothetical protein